MTPHPIGPYWVRMFYQVADTGLHVQNLPVRPPENLDAVHYSVRTGAGNTIDFASEAVPSYVAVARGLLSHDSGYVRAELVYMYSDGDVGILQQVAVGAEGQGTKLEAHTPMMQMRMSFRSERGNPLHLVFMLAPGVPNTAAYAPYPGDAALAAMNRYVCGEPTPQDWVCPRDRSRVQSGIRALSKTNDHARREAGLG